jgi:hypothetical protein
MRSVRISILLLVFSLSVGMALAQFGPFDRGRFGRFFSPLQNDPPDTEFIFARWRPRDGRGGWSHDYPIAEEHINQIMSEATGLSVDVMSYRIVDIASDEIFDFPFGYISEPGMMWLTDEEVAYFREYVDRGGVVMLDDFDGPRHFQIMYEQMKRVFPDKEMHVLTDVHPMLNTYYAINSLYVQSPYNYGAPPVFYGIEDDWGNLQVIICHNNDLGDYWEHIDEGRFPLELSTEALRIGINIVIYAMTH